MSVCDTTLFDYEKSVAVNREHTVPLELATAGQHIEAFVRDGETTPNTIVRPEWRAYDAPITCAISLWLAVRKMIMSIERLTNMLTKQT
jgi:hypothetical protein